MTASASATPRPLNPPGSLQFYMHTTFGWLLARACQLAGTDLRAAWAEMAAVALDGDGSGLALTPPPSSRFRIAEPFKAVAGPSVEDFAMDLDELSAFVDACDRITADESTAEQRAHGARPSLPRRAPSRRLRRQHSPRRS